jgi:bifunctional non-homologous end joining protein LigD
MNAVGMKDEDHLIRLMGDTNYAAQEKLDGMRAIIHICKDGLRIFSRSAGVDDPTRPLEKTSSLPHMASMRLPDLAGTILDAEILAPGVDVAAMSGAIHSKHASTTNGLVKAFVFDVLRYNGEDHSSRTLHQRIGILEVLKTRIHSPYIVFLPWAFTANDKRKLYDDVLKRGGEGAMLKRLDATYVQSGRPSNNWFKVKKSATFDCVVTGFTRGKGKYNNHIGAVKFGQYINGKLVELGQASGMSDLIRFDMAANPNNYVGRVVTIRAMERLRSGSLRHPIFGGLRHDKKPTECIYYSSEQ